MKALTRKEIIEIWKEQPDDLLNSFCCPNCRDLLFNYSGTLMCRNSDCLNSDQFDKETGEQL
jgi:hypothetical protein